MRADSHVVRWYDPWLSIPGASIHAVHPQRRPKRPSTEDHCATRQWDGSQNTMIRAPAVEEGDSATGGHHDRTIAR